ncbi:LexA family transcriptional regulator [Puteibacter caeruleilacunae]|nr:LexA family transcriptional regulator [Puteibacter caeruleilacunae]
MSIKIVNYLNKNIKTLRKRQGDTQEQLANKLGIKRSLIGSYEENRAYPKIPVLQDMAKLWNYNIDQLINIDLAVEDPNELEGADNLRVLSIVTDQENREQIAMVPIKASAGYLNGYADPEYVGQLPNFHMPLDELSAERTYRVFQTKGDSMLPVPSGAYVFCEYVADWQDVREGETFVVITLDEGIVYKRLFGDLKRDGHWEFRSDNVEYDSYLIKAEGIKEVWRALGVLSFDLPDPDSGNLHSMAMMLADIKRNVEDLKKK